MRPITVIRALAWIAVVITGWSLTVAWGTDISSTGPPPEWKKEVVGGLVLTLLAAVLLMVSGTSGGKQRWLTRGIAAGCAAGSTFIALSLRGSAMSSSFPDLIEGPGWIRFAAGSGLCLALCIGALLLPAKKRKVGVSSKKARRRRNK